MKIAVTSEGVDLKSNVDPRFGRAKFFLVIDSETGQFEAHNNTQNLNAAQGAGIQAGQTIAQLGVEAIVTGNVGPKAFHVLSEAGVRIYLCDGGTVEEAVDRWRNGSLAQVDQASKPGHWM